MSDFENKVVLITGAAGALGQAVVEYFAVRGARPAQLDIVAIDNEHYSATCDLTATDSCKAVVADVVTTLGSVDVLANIAGGFAMGETVHMTSDNTWNFLMGLNAESVLNMARVVVPQMLSQGSGKIVNIGAGAGLKGAPHMGAYSASKAVVIRLTEAMSGELKARNINVNCILPSIIDTPRNREDMPDADFNTWVTPEAMAEVVGFLASDASAAVHGVALPVNGLS